MYAIAKSFTFSAWHSLPAMPEGHPCKNRHGHNYTVTVVLASSLLDQYSFVTDYGELSHVGNWLDSVFDHTDGGINEHLEQPSAENMAKYIFEVIRAWPDKMSALLHTVVVQETGKTMAAYTPHDVPIVWLP